MDKRTRQRRTAHRKRLALGRALHQVRWGRWIYQGKRHAAVWIPRKTGLRKHGRMLRREYAGA